jgi:hypothetical protein
MRDDDDADDEAEAALRERENLGDVRVQTLPVLREVFGRAIDAGATDDAALAERYDEAVARLRLDGTLPSGLFGHVVRTQHVALLKSWRDGLRKALEGRLPTGLASNWYGAAPEHRPDIKIVPAIPLTVPLPDGPRTISLYGQSEPLTRVDGETIALTLVTARAIEDAAERDRLRAWLTHLALAASGAGADRRLVSLALGGDRDGEASVKRTDFAPLSADAARAYLGTLAADLLAGVHAYLMPCEGIFTWKRRQGTEKAMTLPQAIMFLRDDGWTHLSSERGPVTNALRYPVPDERDAEARAARRFGALFEAITKERA